MEPFSTKMEMERDGSFFKKNTKNGTEQERNDWKKGN